MKTSLLKTATLVTLLISITLTTGCKTLDPKGDGGQQTAPKTQNTGKIWGALGGLVTGYVVGKQRGNSSKQRNQKALIGGLLGLGGGAIVDKKANDRAAAEFQKQMNIKAEATEQAVNITLYVKFATNSAVVNATDGTQLMKLVSIKKQYLPKHGTSVEGHTDDRGAASYNMSLSNKRAQSVANFLGQQGLSGVVSVGYGESRPTADNKTAAGRSANRRVVVSFINPQPQR